MPARVGTFLRDAAGAGITLIGLCTGAFILARTGLMRGYLACVSWFHRDDFESEFPGQRVISNQMFVVDRDRLTCAGGTSVVHLAAWIVAQDLGQHMAVKALRIMIEEQPLPAATLQPAAILTVSSRDSSVHKAMLWLEQDLRKPSTLGDLAERLGLSRRQLERRFERDIGLTPAAYRHRLRLERGRWLLSHSDLDLTAIALECGFSDASSFSRAVRRSFGAPPGALRNK